MNLVSISEFIHSRKTLFYVARFIVLLFFLSILFFDGIFEFTLSNSFALYALVISIIVLVLALLYDLIYREKSSLVSLVANYFFLTLSMILLFGIIFYANAVKIDPPGFYNTHPMVLKKDVFYFSAVSYFTIGYGDIVPAGLNAKVLSVLEAFTGTVINLVVLALAFRTLNLSDTSHEKRIFKKLTKHMR